MRRDQDRPSGAQAPGSLAPDSDAGPNGDTHLLARRSAQILLLGAGVVTVLNSLVTPLPTVNVRALFVTGMATALASLVVPTLPWTKHPRAVSYCIVVASIAALVGTDGWHHYSRSDAAIAVYPMFFVLVIAFAGLTQPRGTATVVAAISGVALVLDPAARWAQLGGTAMHRRDGAGRGDSRRSALVVIRTRAPARQSRRPPARRAGGARRRLEQPARRARRQRSRSTS